MTIKVLVYRIPDILSVYADDLADRLSGGRSGRNFARKLDPQSNQ